MKFGQLIENPREIFFFENYAENEAEKLARDHFLIFRKVLYYAKGSGLQLDFALF